MKFLITLLTVLTALPVIGQSYNVQRRDMKLATQQLMEKQLIAGPILANATRLLEDQASSASAEVVVTSFDAQPDVCRNLEILPGSTTADVAAGAIVVEGLDALNQSISESFTFTADQSTKVTGNRAFCSVSRMVIHEQDGAGATFDLGVGSKLGLNKCMDQAGHLVFATVDGAFETTRPTIAANSTNISLNTAIMDTALDGAKDVELFFLQNYQCLF